MNCPKCGSKTRMIAVRPNKHGYPKRSRCCHGCNYRFFTIEVLESDVTFEDGVV